MNTDTCPDCSNHPCDCGIPAGCTPRTDELANRLIPIAENITATTAQTIITQVLIDVLTLTTKLETELAAVTEQRDELLRYNEEFRKEYDQAIEQRNEIDSMYHKIIKEVLECDPIPACQREDDQLEPPWEIIARIRKQRDRLAEAMTRIKNIYENPEKGCIPSSSDMYDEALQSLTTNEL